MSVKLDSTGKMIMVSTFLKDTRFKLWHFCNLPKQFVISLGLENDLHKLREACLQTIQYIDDIEFLMKEGEGE